MAECERGDSNPHGLRPRDPKSRASANSATFAGEKEDKTGAWNRSTEGLLSSEIRGSHKARSAAASGGRTPCFGNYSIRHANIDHTSRSVPALKVE